MHDTEIRVLVVRYCNGHTFHYVEKLSFSHYFKDQGFSKSANETLFICDHLLLTTSNTNIQPMRCVSILNRTHIIVMPGQ